jgi:ABC-2 type transport system permease protein
MRLLYEIARRSFQRQLTYRAAALAGAATNVFFGMLRAAVLIALYAGRGEVAGISIEGAISYTGLTQATISFFSLFSWFEVMHSINSGAVGSELLKPVGYYRFWLAQDFGRALAQLFMRGAPIMAAYALIFGLTTPTTAGSWLALAAALLMGWLVSFSFRFLVNLTAFWVPNAIGIGRFAFILIWFMSGFFMPLRFFPEWFQRLCYLTPFPHIVNTVVEIYLGVLSPVEVGSALLAQAAWAGGLIVLGQVVMRMGVRRLVIQGG